jgi:hypothetical protein
MGIWWNDPRTLFRAARVLEKCMGDLECTHPLNRPLPPGHRSLVSTQGRTCAHRKFATLIWLLNSLGAAG